MSNSERRAYTAKDRVRAIRRRHGRQAAEVWGTEHGFTVRWSGNDVAVH